MSNRHRRFTPHARLASLRSLIRMNESNPKPVEASIAAWKQRKLAAAHIQTWCTAGNENVEAVLTHIFQYIGLLRSPSGISEDLFNDAADLSKLGFDFREHPNAFSYTSNLANLMHDYPTTALLLIRHHVMQKFDEGSIRSILDCLNAEEAIIMWTSHDHSKEGMLTEPWYCSPPAPPPPQSCTYTLPRCRADELELVCIGWTGQGIVMP